MTLMGIKFGIFALIASHNQIHSLLEWFITSLSLRNKSGFAFFPSSESFLSSFLCNRGKEREREKWASEIEREKGMTTWIFRSILGSLLLIHGTNYYCFNNHCDWIQWLNRDLSLSPLFFSFLSSRWTFPHLGRGRRNKENERERQKKREPCPSGSRLMKMSGKERACLVARTRVCLDPLFFPTSLSLFFPSSLFPILLSPFSFHPVTNSVSQSSLCFPSPSLSCLLFLCSLFLFSLISSVPFFSLQQSAMVSDTSWYSLNQMTGSGIWEGEEGRMEIELVERK